MNLLSTLWQDSVWSKVIAGLIVALLVSLFGRMKKMSIKDTWIYVFSKAKLLFPLHRIVILIFVVMIMFLVMISSVKVLCTTNKWILWCSFFFPLFSMYMLFSVIVDTLINNKSPQKTSQKKTEKITFEPTVFFHYRVLDAFPGFDNGYIVFDKIKEIIQRLNILLSLPLVNEDDDIDSGVDQTPIWWFRGSMDMFIQSYKSLHRNKILINHDEYLIEKIIAYRGKDYYRDFVYIQCHPDKSTGIYQHRDEDIKSWVQKIGYYWEEFGIYKNKIITRSAYDDGSALINGKPVSTKGAIIRTRKLTKYNFVIAAKYSPYNSNEFRIKSDEMLNKLLRNDIVFDEFLRWMLSLPKNRKDE